MKVTAFMDYSKFQADILKAALAEKMNDYNFGSLEINNYKYHAICVKGYFLVLIPDCFYMLDNNKVFKDKAPLPQIERITSDNADYIPVFQAYTKKVDVKLEAVKLTTGAGLDVFIDKKYMDVFKTAYNLNFKARSNKEPVHVYAGADLIGVILPVRGLTE